MPLPKEFLALAARPGFWPAYFFEADGAFPGPTTHSPRFPVGPRHALVLRLDASLSYVSLGLVAPGARKPVEIAWDDQAHWHPHVLRWEELDLIGRAVALADPTLPHPGWAVVLLHRFTPICKGDDPAVIHPLIREAYRTVGAFTPERVEEAVHAYDRRQFGFAWRRADGFGWCPYQEREAAVELYSLRHPDNADFPIDRLNELLQVARAAPAGVVDPRWLTRNDGTAAAVARGIAESGDLSGLPALADALEEAGCGHPVILSGLRATDYPARGCWLVETLLRLDLGTVIAKALGRTKARDRVSYLFDVTVPTRRRGRFDPALAGVSGPLNDALAAAKLGSATDTGASYSEENDPDEVFLFVEVHDDLRRGLAVIRRVLRAANAPRRTRIELTSPRRRQYPLYPARGR